MSPENLENPEAAGEAGKKPEQEKPLKSKVICAWCNKEIGEIEGIKEGKPSHGICDSCREKHFPKLDKERR